MNDSGFMIEVRKRISLYQGCEILIATEKEFYVTKINELPSIEILEMSDGMRFRV